MNRWATLITPVSYLCLFLVVFGCGRKGDPRPPEFFAPAPVEVLGAKGEVDAITLRWDAPTLDAEGHKLIDLAEFKISRSLYAKDEGPDFNEVATVEVVRDPVSGVLQPSYVYRDTAVEPGNVYEYSVVALNVDGTAGAQTQILRVRFTGESSTVEYR